jgi:hypothetical protein
MIAAARRASGGIAGVALPEEAVRLPLLFLQGIYRHGLLLLWDECRPSE